MRRSLSVLAALILLGSFAAPAQGAPPAGPLAPPPGDVTANLHSLGYSPNEGGFTFNTDLAFWGNYAIQGNFEGFRIIDISAPAKPKVVVDFEECVGGSFAGGQGDVVVWGDILVRTWDAPAPAGGVFCGDVFTPAGQQGLHIFDISDPANPDALAFVNIVEGSHTATGVPDPENNRLLIYSSSSSANRPGIEIVEVPLDDPAAASVLRFEPSGRMCHDTSVILGDAMLVACAGHEGLTVWSVDPDKGGSLEDPNFLWERMVEGVLILRSTRICVVALAPNRLTSTRKRSSTTFGAASAPNQAASPAAGREHRTAQRRRASTRAREPGSPEGVGS